MNGLLGDLTYTYDKVGRRIATGGSFARTGLPSAIATATYDAANQQLALGNKSATFDNDGNLATLTDPSGTTTYTWNSRDQLTNISGPGLTASFQYDGVGRRKQKMVNGTATNFLYDKRNVVQELNGTTPTANLLTGLGLDEPFLRTDTSGAGSVLTDALGSVVALTDTAGTVQTQYTYEPFGNTTVSGAASTNAFQYTGRENDGTGLYYYRARYYHPGLQRFVREDPIGCRGGDPNPYAYVGGDPLNRIDPTGLIVWPGGGPGPGSSDDKCTGLGDDMNNNSCTRNCCRRHDRCYRIHGCNMWSWAWSRYDCWKCNGDLGDCWLDCKKCGSQ